MAPDAGSVDVAERLKEAEDRRAAAEQIIERLRADLKDSDSRVDSMQQDWEREHEKVKEAEARINTYRVDLEEAVDIAHRLLARNHPNTFSYFRERTGDMFLRGREMLKKHGRYNGT